MNNLLPSLGEISPINDANNTFFECGFNKDFNNLEFIEKLQVLCDIVRQTILPNPYPNPVSDIDNLDGDCLTAANVFIKYVKDFNICDNFCVCLTGERIFDPDGKLSRHVVVILHNKDRIYQVDTTPYVGYTYGKVIDITDSKIYKKYTPLNEKTEYILNKIRTLIYLDKENLFSHEKFSDYFDFLYQTLNIEELHGYAIKGFNILYKYSNEYFQKIIHDIILKYYIYYEKSSNAYEYYRDCIYKQINLWDEELDSLIRDDSDIKRQQELCSSIVQELKILDSSYEKWANINNKLIRLSFINPRFLYEEKLNTVMVKPSAYYIGENRNIKRSFIEKFGECTGEYYMDLSKLTGITGVSPMLFSHPAGKAYIRSMTGISNVMLFNANPDDLRNLKKHLRSILCPDLWNKDVIWTDGSPILWHPFVTNLVHSADNYSESALHYLIGYPEHQSMTRFMYPNPKLKWR